MTVESEAHWTGQGLQFISHADSGHGVLMDAAEKVGGSNIGPRPMEMMLHSLAGCTGMDVVSLLKRMRVAFTGLEVSIKAEKAKEHPKTYTRIDLEFAISGNDIDEDKVKRAIELSQDKYCSVSAMLRKACPVNWTYRIAEPDS